MKSTVFFAAIFAVANALPSVAPVSEHESYLSLIEESFAKRGDRPADYKGPACSKFEGLSIKAVPAVCLKSMFCDKLKENPSSEDCGFNGQTRFPKAQIDKMSNSCVEQAICNIVNSQEKSNAKPEPPKQSESVRDIELPGILFQNNVADSFSVKCTDYLTEEKWQFTSWECFYNVLCTQPVPADEPKCTTLDPTKKTYTHEEFTDQEVQCARELMCNRAKNPLVKGLRG